MSRNGFAIHLKGAPKTVSDRAHRRQHEHLDVSITVAGVNTLHEELQSRGALITKPLEERPWSCRDFYVEDPDGYILCFSEPAVGQRDEHNEATRPMDLLIRNVRPEDASSIVDIFNPIISAGIYTVLDAPLTVEGQHSYIAALQDRAIFHVAERKSDGSIVGFQSMEPFPDSYTHAFDHVGVIGTWVDLDCHRQGVARSLFNVMFQTAPERGYEKIFTYIRADNPVALATYESQGFRIVGRAIRQAKLKGSYVDEMIVERML